MSYVTLEQVQAWLQVDKYSLLSSGIDEEQVMLAADKILSALEFRYNTSPWVDDVTTPGMVRRMIAMLVASFTLRKAISEDDGITIYCNWLDARVDKLLEGLVNGSLDLPGVDPDPTAPGAGSITFFPDDAATQLWIDQGDVEGAAARHFTSQMVF